LRACHAYRDDSRATASAVARELLDEVLAEVLPAAKREFVQTLAGSRARGRNGG
jgi:cation transport ATPase